MWHIKYFYEWFNSIKNIYLYEDVMSYGNNLFRDTYLKLEIEFNINMPFLFSLYCNNFIITCLEINRTLNDNSLACVW